jgi:hypothetical protein
MTIYDTSKTTKKPGEPVYGNQVEADLARLNKGLAHAVKNDDKTLIEFYGKKIAQLKAADLIQKTVKVPKNQKKKGKKKK